MQKHSIDSCLRKNRLLWYLSTVVTLLLSWLIVGVCSPALALKPAKDDTIGVRDWLIVPVFYATNRVYSGLDGSVAYSDEPNNSGLLFGVKNVAVPKPTATSLAPEKLRQMRWQEVLEDPTKAGQVPPVVQQTCPMKDRLLSRDEVVQSFQSYVSSTGANDSVIFVHGCCANFDTSMARAGKIAAHLGTAVLLYDWVSPVGFSKYLQNETRVKQTMDGFCRFLSQVDKVFDPGTVTLFGHSMGSEFVDEAMVRRAIVSSFTPLKPFREIIMSNADTDARTFLQHSSEFASNASIVRLYISRNDDRLNASAFAHGGFERLGEPGSLVTQLAQLKGQTVIDITEADTGHEIPFSIVAALHANNNSLLSPAFTLEKCEPGYFCLKRQLPLLNPTH
jgi:esterase/lipase superfamily enzyme